MSHTDDFDEPAGDGPEELQTYFGNVVEFVDHWLLPHYARNPKLFRWSPRWWEYTEVVGRLEALWRAWEYYRLEGMTGMAVLFNDYMDPTRHANHHLPGRAVLEPRAPRQPRRARTVGIDVTTGRLFQRLTRRRVMRSRRYAAKES